APAPRRPPPPPPPAPRAGSGSLSLESVRRLANRGDHDEALLGLAAYLREHPMDPTAYLLGGVLHLESGDLPGAEEHLRKCIYLEDGRAAAHLHLGMVLEQRGDLEGARQALGNALVLAAGGSSAVHPGELSPEEVAQIAGSQLNRMAERGRVQ
ncbi:MAG: tetratricopeptide repeat protein, partial [Deltaproteobacteria bacterium]|nr:tetratricopeptide repeat protein [Deltaproteobacteria bacterium]